MNRLYAPVLLFFLCVSLAYCDLPYAEAGGNAPLDAPKHQNSLLSEDAETRARGDVDDGSNYDKRVERYAFGLGRRAYSYNNGNGMKRLPVYNFGLGKRARPYSFGLGKRSDYDDDQLDNDYERIAASYMDEKRNRPYSFGLGKRAMDDVDRRGYPNRYGFGLGRR